MAVTMAHRSYRPSRRRRSSTFEGDFAAYLRKLKRPRPNGDKDKDDGGVPVEPNKPNTLSGGAAAALEFDD